jgi:hypothetical protein
MRALHSLLVGAALMAACGTDDSTTPTVDGPLEPAPPEGGQQLATSTWKLQPGEEKYVCFQFYSPSEEVAITRVEQLSAPGIHHFALFQAFGRNEPDEVHECNTLIKQTWMPIYVSGTGDHNLDLPVGTGFVIAPETQYIIQLHLQNNGDEVLDVRGGVNLSYNHDVASVTPAGMYALGNYQIDIPAGATNYSVPVSCQPGKDMHVFGVFPHMHKLGTKIEMTRTVAGGTPQPFYKIDPWRFGDAPVDMMDQAITPTDSFDLTCTYANPGTQNVGFGESSDNEMCFFVMFYYPYDHLDGCIIGG